MTTLWSPPAPTCRSPTTRRPRRRSTSAAACNSSPFQWISALKSRVEGARCELQRVQARAKTQTSPISRFSKWAAHIYRGERKKKDLCFMSRAASLLLLEFLRSERPRRSVLKSESEDDIAPFQFLILFYSSLYYPAIWKSAQKQKQETRNCCPVDCCTVETSPLFCELRSKNPVPPLGGSEKDKQMHTRRSN